MPSSQSAGGLPARLPIGEAARELGVTTRTLRYWEEMGLVAPAAHSAGGERLYGTGELERLAHIRDLQKLAGLSLGDIRAVLQTEETLDSIRVAYRADPSIGSRRKLTKQAVDATQLLLDRIDRRLEHLQTFRSQLADKLARRQQHVEDLVSSEPAHPSRPAPVRKGDQG
jgi:MerR family transcriptional regulator, repressor of the yfmOP operon